MTEALLILLSYFFVFGCGIWLERWSWIQNASGPTANTGPPRPKYTEVPHTLSDGTPCTIIRGGTHSGYIGITCNYQENTTHGKERTTH